MAATQTMKPGNPNAKSTPLEVEFDRSIAGGVQYMKTKMQEMAENIINRTKQAEDMEKEITLLKDAYKTAIQKQNLMRRQIYEGEDKIEILEKDVKEITRRLYEKEEYLRELRVFKAGDSIEEAQRMDAKLQEKKQLYKDNYDKFQKARQRKFVLETKQDMVDCTLRAIDSKINALTSELHHVRLEKERKEEETKISEQNTQINSKAFEQKAQDLENMKLKVVEASRRMNSLTMQVSNKETELRSLKFSRTDMENTIKNILKKVQDNLVRQSVVEDL